MGRNWELTQISRTLHIYWGGGTLPYLRYLTVKSFMDLNPQWKVILWIPSTYTKNNTWNTIEQKYNVICQDFTRELMDLPLTVSIVDFEDFGFSNDMPEVHKADYLRSYLLWAYGGLWVDMDVLFFKPMNELEVNTQENKDIETFVCICSYGHSTGFLMTKKGNRFFERLVTFSKREYNASLYQCIGPEIYNKYGKTLEEINQFSPTVNMKMDVVYAHDAHHMTEILGNVPSRFTKGSIGLHWYAGHPMWEKFFRETNGGLTNLPNNIIGNLLRK